MATTQTPRKTSSVRASAVKAVLNLPPVKRFKPTPEQFDTFRRMAQVADPLSDDLLVAMRALPGPEGRKQFEQAVEHGIETVDNPMPELVTFMAELDNVPYWLDPKKIETAQRLISRIPMRSMTMMTIPGFILTYAATRPNQVLIRTGGLEEGASSRIAETISWLVDCTQPGGMDRFGDGFKSCARVRLVHAYVRAAMNGLEDWDYENWDFPVNQAQQALTLLPFTLLSPSLFALGHLHTPRESSAIIHLLRYMSHVVGVRPELQISSLNEMLRMSWLALATEIKPDEFSPRLTKAALEATYAMYDLPGGFLSSPTRWAVYRLHADLAVVTSAPYRKEMGLPGLSPMILAMPGIIGANLTAEVVRMVVPGANRFSAWRGARRRKDVMKQIVVRSRADLSFTKDDTEKRVADRRRTDLTLRTPARRQAATA